MKTSHKLPTADDYTITVERNPGNRRLAWRWTVLRNDKAVCSNLAGSYSSAHTFAEIAAKQVWGQDYVHAQEEAEASLRRAGRMAPN